MALTRAPTAKIIKVSECRGGFDVTCQVLMIRGLNVNYYFAFDVLWVREGVCVAPPPWLHPQPFSIIRRRADNECKKGSPHSAMRGRVGNGR
jgi:hypothetical protein